MERRTFLASLPLFAMGAVGCKKKTSSGGKVSVQLNWVPEPEFGGLYAARHSDAFRQAGFDVELNAGAAGVPIVQLVGSGKADFGITGADDVMIARARGIDLVAVFAPFQTFPMGVMVRQARNLERLDDLKSGTLAIEPGTPFSLFLKKKYAFPGVSVVPYDGGVAKFLVDDQFAQQCYVTSEPISAARQGVKAKVFGATEIGFNPYGNMLVTRGQNLKDDRGKAKAFVEAVAAGWRAYLANPVPANAAMRKLNRAMDESTFDEVAAAQRPLIEVKDTKLGTMVESRWTELGQQLVDVGTISADKLPRSGDCYANLLT